MTELEMDYGLAVRNYRMAIDTWIVESTDDNFEMVEMWSDIIQDLYSEMAFQPKG